MLDELAAEAKAMVVVERPTQPATGIDGLDSLEDFSWTMAGYVVKNWHSLMRRAVVHLGARKKVDSEVTVNEDTAPGGVLECPMEQTAMRSLGQSEPQGSGMLSQMKFLCSTVQRLGQRMHDVQRLRKQMQDVQCLGKQMQDGFAAERVQRQEDFASMRKEMKDDMGEGFRNERMAREQSQKEMRSDIRSEIRSEMDIRKRNWKS